MESVDRDDVQRGDVQRRDVLRVGAVAAVAGATGLGLSACTTPTTAEPLPRPLTGAELLEALWPSVSRRRLEAVLPRDPSAPVALAVPGSRSALVVGGGIAGLSAALELVERGYSVTLREAAPEFGGRLATRDLDPGLGRTFRVEHGLHMWFDNYRVFRDLRDRLGINDRFRPYTAVNFVFRSLLPERLVSEPKVFPLNLANIIETSPNLDWPDIFSSLGISADVLGFRFDGLYERNDAETFLAWIERVKVNPKFRDVVMLPAAHVTLNRVEDLSASEMLLYQHLYFTSQPFAFDREITTVDHGTAIIDPWVARLRSLGATVTAASPIPGLRFEGNRAVGVIGEAVEYDWVILATDVPGARSVLAGSVGTDAVSAAALDACRARIAPMGVAPPYRILRIWFDRPLAAERADVIETPEHSPISLICQFHQLEDESQAWAAATGGSIIEFHLYALDDEVAMLPDDEVWAHIRPTVLEVVPELAAANVVGQTIGNYENFTAFSVGMGILRPFCDSLESDGVANLRLCGDWVQSPAPSALMERAAMTGRQAANACLFVDGVREVGYHHVARTGPLA